jgi:polar amino acid transport system substrate-binding protein
MNKALLAVVAVLLALPVWTPPVAAELVIGSGRKEPFVTPDGSGFYDLLVKALFGRLGIEARCVKLPSERALINADAGIDDGNIARIEGLEARYPNLVRVPGKILDFEFMAFASDTDFKVAGWDSLVPYNIGFITGWKIFEANIVRARSITRVRSPGQLFTLLDHGRADIVMFDRLGGNWWIRAHGVAAHALEPPVAVREMFLYLNKKHAALVPRIDAALEQMRHDGEYQRIYDQVLTPLLGDSGLSRSDGQRAAWR